MDARDVPVVLPASDGGHAELLGPLQWAVVWSNEPQRFMVQHVNAKKPDWAEYRWVPEHTPISEDVACQGLIRVFVSMGWNADMLDDAMGARIKAWANNPMRVGEVAGKNRLMASFTAVHRHLSQGGRLVDVPYPIAEVVFKTFGAEIFRAYLDMEMKDFGAFPQPYADLVGDLWTVKPATAMPRPEALH